MDSCSVYKQLDVKLGEAAPSGKWMLLQGFLGVSDYKMLSDLTLKRGLYKPLGMLGLKEACMWSS